MSNKNDTSKIDLVHYSSHPNLTEVDPKHHGSGVDSRTKGRDTWHPHAFYYKAGTEPEALVKERSPHKYHTSIDAKEQPIYDISEDKAGHVGSSSNMDEAHEKIKASGHHGFYNSKHDTLPHVVAMYHPLKVQKAEEQKMHKFEQSSEINLSKAGNAPKAPASFNPKIRQVAEQHMASKGIKYEHPTTQAKVNPEFATKLASAYHEMKHDPNHPDVKRAYGAFINETADQYKSIKNAGLKVSKIKPGMENPYKSSKDTLHDIHANNHLWYYPTESGFGSDPNKNYSDHPMLAPTSEMHEGKPLLANDMFRIVHDYFGHAKEGNGFGPNGEENAWQNHAKMYSPEAQRAMTAETRGQNSWVNFGPHGEQNRANPHKTIYADQKAGLLPDWAHQTSPDQPVTERKIAKSEETVKELDTKSLKEIQEETAEKWCDRAVEAYNKAVSEKSIKWLMDAVEYGHEAIEHSSLGEDLAVFEKIRAKLMPAHKEAIKALVPDAA